MIIEVPSLSAGNKNIFTIIKSEVSNVKNPVYYPISKFLISVFEKKDFEQRRENVVNEIRLAKFIKSKREAKQFIALYKKDDKLFLFIKKNNEYKILNNYKVEIQSFMTIVENHPEFEIGYIEDDSISEMINTMQSIYEDDDVELNFTKINIDISEEDFKEVVEDKSLSFILNSSIETFRKKLNKVNKDVETDIDNDSDLDSDNEKNNDLDNKEEKEEEKDVFAENVKKPATKKQTILVVCFFVVVLGAFGWYEYNKYLNKLEQEKDTFIIKPLNVKVKLDKAQNNKNKEAYVSKILDDNNFDNFSIEGNKISGILNSNTINFDNRDTSFDFGQGKYFSINIPSVDKITPKELKNEKIESILEKIDVKKFIKEKRFIYVSKEIEISKLKDFVLLMSYNNNHEYEMFVKNLNNGKVFINLYIK